MFPERNIFCSDLLLSLDLPSSIVFMFGADHIFFSFPFGNGNLKSNGILNEKKNTWRKEEFHFSVFLFLFSFFSPIFPFTLSPTLSLKMEGNAVSGEKTGTIFIISFFH